jgi:hypothetical protein
MPDERDGADGGCASGEQLLEGERMNHAAHNRPGQPSEPPDSSGHDDAWLLLPWLANGTLDAEETRQVESHVAACERCRHELERCQDLAAALRSGPETAPSPHPIQLARLMARLDAADAADAADAIALTAQAHEHDAHAEHPEDAATDTLPALAALVALPPPPAAHDANDANDANGANDPNNANDPNDTNHAHGAHDAGDNTLQISRAPETPAAPAASLGTPGSRLSRSRLAAVLAATPRPVRFALAAQLAALLVLALGLSFGLPASGRAGAATAAAASARSRALFHTLSAPSAGAATAGTPETPGIPEDTGRADASDPGAAAPRPQIRLVFSEQATERQIRDVLMKVRGRLVDGPSPLGTYTIEIPAPPSAATAPAAGTSDAAASRSRRAARADRPLDGAPDSLGIVLAYLTSQPIVRFAEPVAGISSANPQTLPRS